LAVDVEAVEGTSKVFGRRLRGVVSRRSSPRQVEMES
jgi:hypothetical protein